MKSLKGLVFRYIWKNKLRTTMTIVAITIASFIIFGLFLLGYNINYNIYANAYELEGKWDASYVVDKETARELLKFKNKEGSSIDDKGCRIDTLFVSTVVGDFTYIDDMSFFVKKDLKYGRFPQNENEIVAPTYLLNNPNFITTPNPKVGRMVKPRVMVPCGITVEEYILLEKEYKRELLTTRLEEYKKDNKELYDSLVEKSEDLGVPATECMSLTKAERERLTEFYNEHHEDIGEEKLLTGVYEVDYEYDTPGIESKMYSLSIDTVNEDSLNDGYFDEDYYNYNMNNSGAFLSRLNIDLVDKDSFAVLVRFKDKTNLEKKTELLGERIGYEGEVNETAVNLFDEENANKNGGELFIIAFFMLICAVFGLVVMVIIRNSFNISVNERERDYGMYRCVGLTRRQIIRMILLEALIVGIIGTALGMFFGSVACRGLFSLLNDYDGNNRILQSILIETGSLRFHFIGKAFGMVVLYMAVIVGYSMISPIEKLYKMSPINSLRSKDGVDNKTLKKLLKRKKKSDARMGFLKYPEWYGFKNIKIRKGRFYLLVISLGVCFAIVLVVGCVIQTILNTEFNNQLKPTYTVDGYQDYVDDPFSLEKVDNLEKGLSSKSGLVDIEYSIRDYYNAPDELSKEKLAENLESVCFMGIREKYYKLIEGEAEGLDYTDKEGVINVILLKGDLREKDYLPEIGTGDDIELYGTRLHIAGIIPNVLYEDLLKKKLPETMDSGVDFTFIYLRDFDGSVIDEDRVVRDGNDYFSIIEFYIYTDVEEEDGSIQRYLEENGYYIDTEGHFDYDGVRIVKKIVYTIVIIILFVIMLNLTNIKSSDILQRRNEIRLLRNIGFSKREIRRAVLAEGILVSVESVIFGALLGIFVAYGLSRLLYAGNGMTGLYHSDFMKIRFGMDWAVFIITAVSIFVINIATSLMALSLIKDDYK
ncbi:ABC-type transport system, involved in lipoprotein release, permease component [Eubacterium ruminantium]|uniref:ABC-type transport system, involved in lipoprotein release, permease component n=1 Tax=Eubacterium ruminantium TaxID=42322 RepID=A0A1T4KSB5_9FIRM|nr:ABC transporter permease [Eubacterium ruminantium]SCW34401.1 ABC-type transport system, involved in lipoprotein release, permease component [Eubacterium ruminantium]SDM32922.1 ABC-type transport system, involved in lipoprotein release, permease component [Eubacterium ruminantium]SJZ45322.1 ABC-type transport system, involved in lipoprotein release, permease component [Eubacterium ruminantium]